MKGIIVLSLFLYLYLLQQTVEAFMNNDTNLNCCLNYDYAADGKAAGCETPTGDRMKVKQSSCAECLSYQCIDWTIGSASNLVRQAAFKARTRQAQDVYFGVGSYGNNMTRAGYCYRISLTSVANDIIVQVVNQGADVPDGNFDLMVADGGFGLFDACADSVEPLYKTNGSLWGAVYGGVKDITYCKDLPEYSVCGYNTPEDSLIDLCKWSFQKKIRTVGAGDTNPKIKKMCQVACPVELYSATGLHRSDEKSSLGFDCTAPGVHLEPPGGHMTRMMDCAKPSYGWAFNVKYPTYPNFSAVVPCRRDGYTRINQMPGRPTMFPTAEPTIESSTVIPTIKSSVKPSRAPTYKNTIRPTTTQTLSPSYQFAPTPLPSQQPSVFNGSLQSHNLPIVRFESVLRVDGVYYSSKTLFDASCQIALCAALDDTIGLTVGSTVFVDMPIAPKHMTEEEAQMQSFAHSTAASLTGYHSVFVRVRSSIRRLSPEYAMHFSSLPALVEVIGVKILTAVSDGRLTSSIRKKSQSLNAIALLRANVTSGNVSYIPIPAAETNFISDYSSPQKMGSTIIAVIVFACIVGLLLAAIAMSRYSKLFDGGNSQDRAFYTITRSQSTDSMEENGLRNNVFHAVRQPTTPDMKSQAKAEKREIIHTPKPRYEKEDRITIIYDDKSIA